MADDDGAGVLCEVFKQLSAKRFESPRPAFAGAQTYLDEVWSGPDFLSHAHDEDFLRFFEERC